MNLTILSPEKEIFSGDVKSVKVPGSAGQFEMLDNHAPIVASLAKGEIRVLTDKGEFSVSEIHLENVKTRADHRLLYNLSEASGAAMVMPSNMNTLPELIRSNESLQSVSHETKILQDLINVKWILFVILALLSVEWLLRKRNGTY